MKLQRVDPPREFEVGHGQRVTIKDTGRIELDADEQVTFVTQTGAQYDVCRKSWGFYATPSLNSRLAGFGLRGALIRGADGKAFVMLVETGKEEDFQRYLDSESLVILSWLDTDNALNELEGRCSRI